MFIKQGFDEKKLKKGSKGYSGKENKSLRHCAQRGILSSMATILSINNSLDDAWRSLGHTVHSVHIAQGGLYSVQEYVAQCPKEPDFFFQKEALAMPVFFSDVHNLACPTAFWGIDSHLRYGWQMHYAAFFDVFFTPHKSFLQRLSKEWLHPYMHRLVECGFARPFVPHEQRTHAINFVGRLTATRPQRAVICKLLQERYQVPHVENISQAAMLDLYNQTRIVPNESIANEVNFRLMEGASCGCALVTPHIGEDQDSLFETEKEILVYSSMDMFMEHMDRCLHDTAYAARLGQAAWARVQREHLPVHMAAFALEQMQAFTYDANFAADYLPKVTTAAQVKERKIFLLSMLHFHKVFELQNIKTFLQDRGAELTALSLVAQIFLTMQQRGTTSAQALETKESIFALLEKANACILGGACLASHKKMLAVACAGAALHFNDAPRGNFYLYLYQKVSATASPSSSQATLKGAQDTLDVALNWVLLLAKEQKQCLLGTDYISGCCRTAFDFVSLCQEQAPQDMRWMAALATLDDMLAVFPFAERDRLLKLRAAE